MKSLFPLPFPGKIWFSFAIFGIFLRGNRAESQNKVIEPKFDKYYFIHTIPGQIPLNKIGSNIFQLCGYRSQRTFQKNFNLDFQIWLVFLVPFLHFLKTQVKLSDVESDYLMLNRLVPVSNPKNEKPKSLYVLF